MAWIPAFAGMTARLVILLTLLFSPAVSAPTLPAGVSKEQLAADVAWKAFKALPPGKRPRIILVLGGGGARGLAHVGVLRALQEEGIPVDEIVGVSVGALIGALYSAGISVDEIEGMAHDIGWSNLTDVSRTSMMKLVLKDELFSSAGMGAYLSKHIGDRQFSDLKIPFACVATDIRTGERVIFREGPVAMAAQMSATIPAIFKPVEYKHRLLVDGGLVDNLPTDVARDDAKGGIVIGVLPVGAYALTETNTVFKGLVRAIDIQKDIILETKRKEADYMIEPNVGSVSMVDLGRGRDCIEAGEMAARRDALDIKALILNRMKAKETEPKR